LSFPYLKILSLYYTKYLCYNKVKSVFFNIQSLVLSMMYKDLRKGELYI